MVTSGFVVVVLFCFGQLSKYAQQSGDLEECLLFIVCMCLFVHAGMCL